MVPKYVPPAADQARHSRAFSSRTSSSIRRLREYIRKGDLPELAIATWGTHDHRRSSRWYQDLTRRWHGPDGHEAWLELQRLMRFLGEDENAPPENLTEKLHEAFMRTLLEAQLLLGDLHHQRHLRRRLALQPARHGDR